MNALSDKLNKRIVNLVYFDPRFAKVRGTDIHLKLRCDGFPRKSQKIPKNEPGWHPLK